MSAAIAALTVKRSETFRRTVTWKSGSPASAVNITDYTAALSLCASDDPATPVLALTDSSGITLGGVAGTIAWAADVSALDVGTYSFDLLLTSPASVTTCLLTGTVEIQQEYGP